MFFGRATLSQQGGSNSHPQAHKPKSPSTSVQDPSQLQGGPLSGPTLSPTPSAPMCLATGRPGGIVTFSRPRPAKLWTRTRGAWHGQYKNPIPSLLGWKPRPNRECNVSLWRRLRDDNRGLRPRKFEARRQCPPCYSHTRGVTFRGGQAQSTRTLDLEPDASVFNRESEVVVSTFVFPSGYHVGP